MRRGIAPTRPAMHEFNYSTPTGIRTYQGRDVHTLQSVTKSIAATVIGIALGRGEIAALDRPFLQYFKDRDLSRAEPRLAARRWRPAHDEIGHRVARERSAARRHEHDGAAREEPGLDRVHARQPMDADPGTKWAYNSGGSQLMSGIIRSATGRFIDEYAREPLFRPLGSATFTGRRRRPGIRTPKGLYCRYDLAKIGYSICTTASGTGGASCRGWVKSATTRMRAVGPAWDYGYQWWITNRNGVRRLGRTWLRRSVPDRHSLTRHRRGRERLEHFRCTNERYVRGVCGRPAGAR